MKNDGCPMSSTVIIYEKLRENISVSARVILDFYELYKNYCLYLYNITILLVSLRGEVRDTTVWRRRRYRLRTEISLRIL